MKIVKYILIGVAVLIGLNLLTFYLFGKRSLRDRNMKEMIKEIEENNFQNSEFDYTYTLISTINLKEKLFLNQRRVSIFPLDSMISETNHSFEDYVDSVINMQYFNVPKSKANLLLSTNLDSLESVNFSSVDSLINQNLERIVYMVGDSIKTLPVNKEFWGDCMFYEYLNCRTYEGWVIMLGEEVYFEKPFMAEQRLVIGVYADHYEEFRDEQLFWFIFKWVQIKWIDGNGFAGDKVEPAYGPPEPPYRDWKW